MGVCDQCGNTYDKSFELHRDGKVYTFDCFECAIAHRAPTCARCGTRIIGHGREVGDTYYCSEHCLDEHHD